MNESHAYVNCLRSCSAYGDHFAVGRRLAHDRAPQFSLLTRFYNCPCCEEND
jgi:hypothetical protein